MATFASSTPRDGRTFRGTSRARRTWRTWLVLLLALSWLARAAVPSDVCIGVRKDEQGFQAHAWLKVGEQIVTGGDISSYAELPLAQIGQIPFSE